MRGVAAWVKHFQRIQATGVEAEIVVPFKEVFQQGDKIHTYHVERSREHGKPACSLLAGHAVLRDGRIASITLVRTDLDAGCDPACWSS